VGAIKETYTRNENRNPMSAQFFLAHCDKEYYRRNYSETVLLGRFAGERRNIRPVKLNRHGVPLYRLLELEECMYEASC